MGGSPGTFIIQSLRDAATTAAVNDQAHYAAFNKPFIEEAFLYEVRCSLINLLYQPHVA